ncbi:MAG: ABC transporter transmembrane domain-containing protein, partial [Oscillospiraceae bacterium]
MRKLIKYLKNYKWQAIIGAFFKFTEAVLELFVPLIMAKIIDIGVANKDGGYVLKMGGLLLFLGAVGLLFATICQYLASLASQGVGTILRNEMYRKINRFSHADINHFGTPSLITRLTNDVNQLQIVTAMLIRLVVRAPFLAIGAVAMALTLDLKLSIILLITLPLIVLVIWMIMSRSVPFFKIIQKKMDRISLITRENLEGTRVIRAFSKQSTEKKRFSDASDDLAETAVNVGKLSALLNPLTYIIMNMGIVAVLWFGGGQVFHGDLTQGELIAFVNYMTQILLALVIVANLVVIFTKGAASAARINEVLDTKETVNSRVQKPVTVDLHAPHISFDHVSFSYEGAEEMSLKDISVDIHRGETIGIIGGTGSGKSTLIQLIP